LAQERGWARATKAWRRSCSSCQSIGYVEYAYAKQNKMSHVLVKNQAGTFVAPDDLTFKAAAAGAEWSKTFYPGADRSARQRQLANHRRHLHLMHKAQDKPATATTVLKFFDWAYANGDKAARNSTTCQLPATVKDLIHKQWSTT